MRYMSYYSEAAGQDLVHVAPRAGSYINATAIFEFISIVYCMDYNFEAFALSYNLRKIIEQK